MAKAEGTIASIAAAATSENSWTNERFATAPYNRNLRGFALASQDNTPVMGELLWELYAGQVLLAKGRSILVRTAGAEFTMPDDYSEVNRQVPSNTVLVLKVQNTDAASAHSGIYSAIFDVL